jgi:hypothetical protein
MISHHQAGLTLRGHVAKAGLTVGCRGSHVGVGGRTWFYRIALDDLGTLRPGVVDGCPQEPECESLAPEAAVHEEADY